MTFIIFDTNVLVSSMLSRNIPFKLFNEYLNGRLYILYSSAIMREYYEVLNRDKFPFPAWMVEVLIDEIEKYGFKINPIPTNVDFKDKTDKKFYDLLSHCSSVNTYLVTGNKKDFPIDSRIVSPSEMIEILNDTIF